MRVPMVSDKPPKESREPENPLIIHRDCSVTANTSSSLKSVLHPTSYILHTYLYYLGS